MTKLFSKKSDDIKEIPEEEMENYWNKTPHKIVNNILTELSQEEIEKENTKTQEADNKSSNEQWKVGRRTERRDLHEQLDVIWDQFQKMRNDGIQFTKEANDMLDEISITNLKFPR